MIGSDPAPRNIMHTLRPRIRTDGCVGEPSPIERPFVIARSASYGVPICGLDLLGELGLFFLSSGAPARSELKETDKRDEPPGPDLNILSIAVDLMASHSLDRSEQDLEKEAPMISRILLTVISLAILSFLLLVLIGLWSRYEAEAERSGFSGAYERYLASQAGFPNDPKVYPRSRRS